MIALALAGLTVAELAALSPLRKHAESHLRIVNDLHPAGEPVAGEALKIVDCPSSTAWLAPSPK